MIDRAGLLKDLQKLLRTLENDLRERCGADASVDAHLHQEYERARAARRTAHAYDIWRDEYVTQVGAAWILACVFVRFLEDNGLIDAPRLAGPGPRLGIARDHHTLFISEHPAETDREYLHSVFREAARLPALGAMLSEAHNPLFAVGLSADGARDLLSFWQRIDQATGELVHDFTDPTWNTRFLGDLYQDLSEAARKTYALLQTPEFVEEFILDRTLEPAIQEFGYQTVRMIDIACGSGHFLLGTFARLFARWSDDEPASNPRELAQRTLDAIDGVDLNPFAVAIARFRLLVAALRASDIRRLADAPGFRINLAVGDSLLHGSRPAPTGLRGSQRDLFKEPLAHVYDTEDAAELRRILEQRYHVVVGNPPYITVKDSALNEEYRSRFRSCHRQYSLAVPFMERFFDLAITPTIDTTAPAGYIGMITANSFMKREFGKKLIEEFIPRWDLTHIVDTSRAHVPGHGTPTVILLARNKIPISSTLRAALGIRAESKTPDDPSKGLVWAAIVAAIDQPGSQTEFVSVADVPRDRFHSHPWSIGGGGAAELKTLIDSRGTTVLKDLTGEIGRTTHTGEDDVFYLEPSAARTRGLAATCVPLVTGEDVRDYVIAPVLWSLFPYDRRTAEPLGAIPIALAAHFWRFRTTLRRRKDYGQTPEERGLRWFDHSMFFPARYRTPLSIAFAFVSTHNHFAIDRGGTIFNRTAPVIILRADRTAVDHLELLAVLNSSTACFWMKQVFFNRGGGGIGGGLATEEWEQFYEFDATKIAHLPLPSGDVSSLGQQIERLATTSVANMPTSVVQQGVPSSHVLSQVAVCTSDVFQQMIAVQEEIDWHCYRLYGLISDDLTYPNDTALPALRLGERAFEIALARRVARGEFETEWYSRHGSVPITEMPPHWPDDYRRLVDRRVEAIASNPNVALIEQPEYKRRWNSESWGKQQERALRGWLLDRLENDRYWRGRRLTSCARLADHSRDDAEFIQVAELYRGRADFDLTALVTELVEEEGVPFLPILRYTESGLRKHQAWEECWALQRREDAGETVGEIAVPPKYVSADFRKGSYWRRRGKLDVPKERFILYPGAERDADRTPVLGWAGWDALQQAEALAAYFNDMKESEAWPAERLAPLLTGLIELLPWLRQWHNDLDREMNVRMGDHYSEFVDEAARSLGVTIPALRAWRPSPLATTRRQRRRS